MARKPLSPEQKARNAENLKKAREAKKAKTQAETPEQEQPQAQAQTVEVPTDVLNKLLSEVEELKANRKDSDPLEALKAAAAMQGVSLGKNGIQGIQYKYSVEKGFYPDPTEQLYQEPRLTRFNLRENYIFKWDVEGVIYESNNVTYGEPRFVLELFQRMYDNQGNDTGKMFFIKRAYIHEDELSARLAADKLGLTDKFDTFEDMMNSMRYLVMRNWLLEIFYPKQITTRNTVINKVIDGKPVQIHDNEEFVDAASGVEQSEVIQDQVRVPEY
jgi:chemotaxis protein histidine kinase CheA